MLKSMRKSKNRYFYHIFVSPGDALRAITVNVYGWKENSMLTNCLAACAHLTITVSEIERDISRKSSIFHMRNSKNRSPGDAPEAITLNVGMEKLEWCGYPMVKKFRRYLYSF